MKDFRTGFYKGTDCAKAGTMVLCPFVDAVGPRYPGDLQMSWIVSRAS